MELFWSHYWVALAVAAAAMTVLWAVSVPLRNASIVDPFWGPGFVLCGFTYWWSLGREADARALLVLTLLTLWGLRLGLFLAWRNHGKGEDFRYRKFREDFGPDRYWWYSLPSVFLLQGLLMWLISSPLLGAQLATPAGSFAELGWIDACAVAIWLLGFVFEAGADWQLARFKSDPANRGQLLSSGFWRWTRHPNYFGDAAVWWGFGLFAVAAGRPLAALGAVAMTALIVKVSGVALLETSLRSQKPGYAEYARRTSAFIPWFPKR
ncbi:MAG: DUF1295 domain-containing protein [Planctomycetota bacterium]